MPAPSPSAETLARMRRLRWVSFALVSAAYVLSFFHRIAPSAIESDLRSAFHASGAELGALAATYFAVYTVMQVPTGILVDALGPRRIAAIGGVVAGLGAMVFGRAESLAAAGAGRAFVGLGVSVTFVALLKLVAAWFHERQFATLSGLVMFMGNIGALLSSLPLAWAVTVTSWRHVFVAVGSFSLLGAAVTWLVVRDDPREAGLPSMRELEGRADNAPRPGRWWDGLWLVMRNPATWPGFFVNFGLGGAYLAFAGLWAVPYLAGVHGMSRGWANAHNFAMLVAFALSSLATGALSDFLGRRRALTLAFGAVHVLCWIPWLAAPALPLAATLPLVVLMGASATGFTLSWASVKEVNPPALSGTAMAVVNTGVFLGPTIYQPLVGWVLDRSGFRAGIGVLAVFSLTGLLAALLLRETRRTVAAGETPPVAGGTGGRVAR